MRFRSLGSGSSGNATLVEAQGGRGGRTSRLLVDCGFTLKELEARLGRVGLGCAEIDAVFVTHEHGDHVGCALTLARRHGVPLWMSRGTWRAVQALGDDGVGAAGAPALVPRFARDGEPIEIGALQVLPFTVPHDAAEPLQLVCSDGVARLAVLTDAGSLTPHMRGMLAGCDALLLETNHDRAMLAGSSYPESLKRRIGGRLGHLANELAAELLDGLRHPRLRHVVAAHLSLQNNRPELAAAALAGALACAASEIVVAHPQSGCDWLDLR